MPLQLPIFHNDLNREEVTGSAEHRPPNCAVDDHLRHHEQSICAVGDHILRCNPRVCAVGDRVLPESKKEQVEKPPEPTQQELVVTASEQAVFSKTVYVGQFFKTMAVCEARTRITAPYCKEFTQTRSIEGCRIIRSIFGTTKIGAVLDVFVSEEQGLLCVECRHQCIIL